eukprot:CAMPEP_0167739978 /NCGR_PEP_ID=MMETSP0110_2-20121227/21_1 /TAXON_ID=629695 /ORGANISM="Gymnochlora sp., Strain CCMP2014" /LENGTH=697 /DNA_ID=CAMNT_0007623819 /DNA_START=491 /DNA_END=2584 /DNA_ORIENTATION=+
MSSSSTLYRPLGITPWQEFELAQSQFSFSEMKRNYSSTLSHMSSNTNLSEYMEGDISVSREIASSIGSADSTQIHGRNRSNSRFVSREKLDSMESTISNPVSPKSSEASGTVSPILSPIEGSSFASSPPSRSNSPTRKLEAKGPVEWFYKTTKGKIEGPVRLAFIRSLVQKGILTLKSHVWKMDFASSETKASWRPIGELEELIPSLRRSRARRQKCRSVSPKLLQRTKSLRRRLHDIKTVDFSKMSFEDTSYRTISEVLDKVIMSMDTAKRHAFTLTIPYFASTKEILSNLYDRIDQTESVIRRKKALHFLMYWVEKFPMDFRDGKDVKELDGILALFKKEQGVRNQVMSILKKELEKYDKEHEAPTDKLLWPFESNEEIKRKRMSSTASRLRASSVAIRAKLGNIFDHLSFMRCGEKELAIELTLIADERARSMHPRDYIKERYKRGELHRNQSQITERFCNWISTSVLLNTDHASREKVMRSWVKVGYYCLKLKNFMTAVEILTALSIAPVFRLSQSKAVYTNPKFKKMNQIMSYKKNYHSYRAYVKTKTKNRPWVPYLGVVFKDLYGLEASKPRIKEVTEDGETKVLFHKCLKIQRYLAKTFEHKKYQFNGTNNFGFEMKPNSNLRKFIGETVIDAVGLDDLFALSYKIQPKRARTPKRASSLSPIGSRRNVHHTLSIQTSPAKHKSRQRKLT